MATLIAYLIAADKMSADYKLQAWRMFNEARHPNLIGKWAVENYADAGELEDLPEPIVGNRFTVAEAKRMLMAAQEMEAEQAAEAA